MTSTRGLIRRMFNQLAKFTTYLALIIIDHHLDSRFVSLKVDVFRSLA
jgi:hypothetical protein